MGIDGETVRIGAVRQTNLVVVTVHDTVGTGILACLGIICATYILEYQHTGTDLVLGHAHIRGDVILCEVLLNVLERTEHADALHTPQTDVCTVASLDGPVDILCGEVHVQHFVVVVACAQTDAVLEVLADFVAPGQRELPTPAVHLTDVGRGRLRTYGGRHCLHNVHQHLAVLLEIVVEADGQTFVEHLQVETEVGLIRLVPMHVGVYGRIVLVDGDTAARGTVLADYHTTVGILGIDLHPLPGGEVVTTGKTPAGTDLQEVDP